MPGSFRLIELLGEGGMGAVWRAEHHPSGYHVALKVVHDVHSEIGRRAFAREIQSVAALNHRGIVHILDVGEVKADDDRKLPLGAPWFAMELSEGGTLEGLQLKSFSELARVLFDVFDALAYAHARGIIHRDLKPSNILLKSDDDHGLRPILTDFGIARASSDINEERTSTTSGTPSYMSPEQFHGDWQSNGPWTDLYSLGCMIWELSTGRVPFDGKSMIEIAQKHFTEPLPKLTPRFDVPAEFEPWLRRLTHKNPEERYRNAAQASWALYRMVSQDPRWMKMSRLSAAIHQSTSVATLTLDSMHTAVSDLSSLGELLTQDSTDNNALAVEAPPVPFHVVEASETHDKRLFGVGLNLFGLRQTPFVGRNRERELLWELLRTATNSPQKISILGASGSGKSRLLDWFLTRVLELGSGQVIRTRHSKTGGLNEGLVPALRSKLGLMGYSNQILIDKAQAAVRGILKRNGSIIDDKRVEQRAEELAALFEPESAHIRFETPGERLAILSWLIRLISLDGPIVLAVDDAHWGWDTLAIVNELSKDETLGLLVVAAREVDVVCPQSAEQLAAFEQDAVQLELGPLSDAEHEAFVKAVAPLERRAAARVAQASQGHPGRAVQFIENLIRAHELVPSSEGYALAAKSNISREFSVFWPKIQARLLAQYPPDKREEVELAMQAAGLFEGEISMVEWRGLMNELGFKVSAEDVVYRAVATGIAGTDGTSWWIKERSHRNELLEACRESTHWETMHRAIARAALPAPGMSVHERRYTILDQAGLEDESAEELRLAVEEYLQHNVYQRASTLADELERRLARLGVAPNDPRRVRLVTVRFEMLRFTGRVRDIMAAKAAFERHVVTCPDPIARADAYRALAGALFVTGDHEGVLHYYGLAAELGHHDNTLAAKLYHGAGWYHSNGPNADEARAAYRLGIEAAKSANSKREEAWNLVGLAEIELRALKPETEELASRALDLFEETGSRTGAAMALQVLGDFARFTGNPDLAEELLLRSIEMLQRTGSVVESMVRGRLGVLYFVTERRTEALEQAEIGRSRYGSLLSLPVRVFDDLLIAVLSSDPQLRAEAWEISESLLKKHGFVHPDVPLLRQAYLSAHGEV